MELSINKSKKLVRLKTQVGVFVTEDRLANKVLKFINLGTKGEGIMNKNRSVIRSKDRKSCYVY